MEQPEKKSFVLYCDQIYMLNKLSDQQLGSLMRTVYKYCSNGREQPVIDDPIVDIVFASIKSTLDRDYKKWLKRVKANRENGKSGGRPPQKEN